MSSNVVDHGSLRPLAWWLLLCAAVIFGMIILGGVTRLTGSGLSMVEWKPLMGVIPPISEAEWLETFEKYQQYPQYLEENQHMDVSGFKNIFYYEYFHRVLGRLIGLLFFIPFVYFYIQKQIPSKYIPKLIVLFVLGGLQGLLGWYMVKSGLVDIPRVSQYRLTAHLGLAVIIYGFMMWLVFSLWNGDKKHSEPSIATHIKKLVLLKRCSVVLSVLLFFMILSGGLVSGIRAGIGYNTFPLMNGYFFPPGLYGLDPVWRSIFEQHVTVQFNHRMFAYLLFTLILSFSFFAYRAGLFSQAVRKYFSLGFILLVFMLLVQVSLGVSTLLLVVPVPLAAAHQGGAILLFTAALFVSNRLLSVWR